MIKKTSLYIDEELLKELKILAIQQGKKVNDLIVKYVEEGIHNHRPNENI